MFSRRGRPGRRNTNFLPWLNPECLKLRDQLLKKSIKSKLNIDRLNFTRARNKVASELRKAKANFFIQVIDSARGNGKKIWQHINKLTGKYHKQDIKGMELTIGNKLVSDPKVLCQELNSFFIASIENLVKQFTPSGDPDQLFNTNTDGNKFQIQEMTEQDTIKIITALNNSKAKDVYGLYTNFLKLHKEALAPPLTHLFNTSIKSSTVPMAWKLSTITPIFKAGDKADMNNYRPISILPVI